MLIDFEICQPDIDAQCKKWTSFINEKGMVRQIFTKEGQENMLFSHWDAMWGSQSML